ncbi:MAG: cytochrome P450, partial [Prochlorothrix sp.]
GNAIVIDSHSTVLPQIMTSIPESATPALFQFFQFALNPTSYQTHLSRRFGDIFRAYISFRRQQYGQETRLFILSEPKALQQILSQDTGKVFSAPGEVNQLLAPLVGNNSVILVSGQTHRRRRQMVTPPFHGERLKVFGDLILQITGEVMAEVPADRPFSARFYMQKLTMRVILEAVFGLHQSDRYQTLEKLLADRVNMSSTPLTSLSLFIPALQKDWGPWSAGRRVKHLAAAIDAILFAEIEERRQTGVADRTDVLSLLMAAEDENGDSMSNEELRDELLTLLLAGHETTATALTWALYWLHRHPETRTKIRAELDTVPTPWDPMALLRLPYLSAFCNEVLRIHPVAMFTFPRRVEQPVTLLNHELRQGDLIMGSIYLLHQREDLYPNSQEFRPERFLEREFSPYEFMPFGGGVRRCVGSALALYELKLALAQMVQHWELSLETQRTLKPYRRGLTLGPNGEVMLRKVADRSPSLPTPTPIAPPETPVLSR